MFATIATTPLPGPAFAARSVVDSSTICIKMNAMPRKATKPARATHPLQSLEEKGFEIEFVSHARSILTGDFPEAIAELQQVLADLVLPITEIIGSGGGETKFTQRTRRALAALGWKKHEFVITKVVDGVPRESTSHEVDHVRRFDRIGVIACEIEWNNKDPFFDRDLENFKRLHAEGAISLGVLITRGATLQDSLMGAVKRFTDDRNIASFEDLAACGYAPTAKQKAAVLGRVGRARNPVPFAQAWTSNFVGNKYGKATTHWEKLKHRIDRGVGNPCPLLLIGLPATIVQFDTAKIEKLPEDNGETGTVDD